MSKRGTRPKSDSELKENKKLKLENKKLRKQLSSLRKQLSRIDIDRYYTLKEELEAQDLEYSDHDYQAELELLKRKWECNTCGRDYLRIILVPRIDGLFYMRRCPTCDYRTKLKKYTNEVEGIDSNEQICNKNTNQIEDVD